MTDQPCKRHSFGGGSVCIHCGGNVFDMLTSAQAAHAALVEAARSWLDAADRAAGTKASTYEQGERLMFDCIDADERMRAVLAAPDQAGAKLLEELERLRKVVEAANVYFSDDPEFFTGLNPKWFKHSKAVRDAIADLAKLDAEAKP